MAPSAGSLVYLHGVGGLRAGWDAAVADSLAPGTARIAVEYADLLSTDASTGDAWSRDATVGADVDEAAGASGRSGRDDAGREAYVLRQRALADALEEDGESVPRGMAWPAGLPRPGDLPDRLPLPRVLRAPMFGLDQVGRYFDSGDRRAAVQERVIAALREAPAPVVVVGHSLGSVVALEALADPRVRVRMLVTAGSPLGHAAVADAVAPGPFPYARVGHWLNLVHLLDPVPFGRGVSTRFPAAHDAFLPVLAGVDSRSIPSALAGVGRLATAHLESTYLRSRTFATALQFALDPVGAAA
ncbi:MAG: hypothetical protein ACKOT0_11140 [bacterium]